MHWSNFHIWRGRLPHWRADGVVYYVTFRHRRPLTADECDALLRGLTRPGIGRPNIAIACVLPELTELLCVLGPNARGEIGELSQTIERAKAKAGRAIIKQTGELYPPFYGESYDRIVRDQAEYDERWQAILSSPVNAELVEDPEQYRYLYVGDGVGVNFADETDEPHAPA